MKRRIVGLLLVIAMLTLALVGCGYSIAEDDLSAYATFTDADKQNFEKLLEKILIEDGDFSSDDAVRAKKVMESIYTALADAADTDDKKTEGKLGSHDIVYYSHYVTAEFDGKTEYFYMSEMKDTNANKLQLGIEDADDKVATAIRAALASFEFKADNAYSSPTTGTVEVGDVVFVTYKTEFEQTKDDGTVTDGGETVSSMMLVVTDDTTTFAGRLNGKTVGSTLSEDITVTEEGRGEVKYTSVKIDWIGKGPELTNFKDKTYTEDKNVANTNGKSRNLKDAELTYHIYPVNYVTVDEFNATSVINVLLGSDITAESMYNILFGEDYVGLHEDHEGHSHTDEEKAENDERLAELKEWLKAYETKDEDGNTVTFDELIETLAEQQEKYSDAKTDLDDKQEDYDTKKADYDAQKEIVDEAGDSATDDQKDKLETKKSTLNVAEKDLTSAKETYDNALLERDASVEKILGFEDMENKIQKGYKIATYNTLQSTYNKEIKNNIAKEIYYFITENIKVNSVPEKALEATYDQLIENYEYEFYTGDFDSTNGITNYKQYKGSFKDFLVAEVTTDIKTVTTYKEALAALKEHAKTYVEPIVRIYVVAKAYGDDVFVSDKEFKDYKNDPENSYSYYEYYYGENSVRYAHQFDELMNYLLESEESEAEANADGFVKVTVNYKKLGYEIGDPASEAETDAEDE